MAGSTVPNTQALAAAADLDILYIPDPQAVDLPRAVQSAIAEPRAKPDIQRTPVPIQAEERSNYSDSHRQPHSPATAAPSAKLDAPAPSLAEEHSSYSDSQLLHTQARLPVAAEGQAVGVAAGPGSRT